MLNMIETIMWLGLGYTGFLQLHRIIRKEFGSFDEYVLLLFCIGFTLLGGITAVIAILFWMAWEWNGKFTLTRKDKDHG